MEMGWHSNRRCLAHKSGFLAHAELDNPVFELVYLFERVFELVYWEEY